MAAVNVFTLEGPEPATAADSNLFSVPASLTDRYRVEEERIAPTAAIPENLPALGEMTFYIPPYTDALLALPELSQEHRGFIRNPRLLIRRYVGTPDFMNSLAKQLVTTTAKYQLEKQLFRVIDIPIGATGTQLPNIHMGQVME
ncbi:hypothetical protein RvY_18738 [Ramazzottius varieornatus]|uniref:Uncharacterized protein n=1 Tax=Ramazzottius varieornatus TaxID=947166 RepID=A0A1D1WAY3_RAMVA|nr:hypothetical protein RvY_18738 [Ramazzottius varieornatus]